MPTKTFNSDKDNNRRHNDRFSSFPEMLALAWKMNGNAENEVLFDENVIVTIDSESEIGSFRQEKTSDLDIQN